MIAIIGPILYLTKGRKLIIKREHNEILNKDGIALKNNIT